MLTNKEEAPSAPQAHEIYGFLHILNSYLVYDPTESDGSRGKNSKVIKNCTIGSDFIRGDRSPEVSNAEVGGKGIYRGCVRVDHLVLLRRTQQWRRWGWEGEVSTNQCHGPTKYMVFYIF